MQLASFSLAEVTYATGDISYLVQEQAKTATFRVKARQDNVSGVILPAFDVDRVSGTGMSFDLTFYLSFAKAARFVHRLQLDRFGTWWSTSS
jgi:vacuolar-type H+-ATPase subunit D/Vma8